MSLAAAPPRTGPPGRRRRARPSKVRAEDVPPDTITEQITIPRGGWVRTSIFRSYRFVISLEASGEVEGDDWVAGPEGLGIGHPDALVSRFPLGALIGRFSTDDSDDIFLLGERYVIDPGSSAGLILAINVAEPSERQSFQIIISRTTPLH